MREWKKVKLGDLLEEYVEKNINNKYKVVAVGRYGIRSREDIYSRELSKNYTNNKVIRKDTLTIGMGSSQIDIGILSKDETFCVSPAYTTYKINNCDSKFLDYYLELLNPKLSNLFMIISARQGKSVDKKGLLSYELDIPGRAMQKKIVNILEKVDATIDYIQRDYLEIQKEREYLKRYFFTKLEKNNNVKKVKISEIFERITEKNIHMESNNILTISAQFGLINQKDFFNKIVAGSKLEGYYLLKKGDFAYNKSYSNGYPVGATKRLKLYDKGIVSTLYICFRAKNIKIHQGFFEYVFESEPYYRALEEITQEGNRNHGLLNISIQDFFKLKIIMPQYDLQEKIYNVLSKYDKKMVLLNKKEREYRKIREALMQQLLTGKIEVKI